MANYNSLGDGPKQIFESATAKLGEEMRLDNKRYVYARSTTTIAKGAPCIVTPVQTVAQSPALIALATETNTAQVFLVGVPLRALTDGDTDWVQVEGDCEITVDTATYTAGRGLKVHNGAVADSGADFLRANTEFGVVDAAQDTPATTVCKAILWGRPALSTT